MSAPAELIVTGPDGTVQRHRIADKAIIGRHPECEIVLTDPMSSRKHCKVERTPAGTYIVEDQTSANGTQLNGERLRAATATPLRNGDTILIGSTSIVLKLDVAARNAPAAPAVKLDDEDVALSFIQKANVNVVTDEEAKSSDVNTLKKVAERLKLLIDFGQSLSGNLDLAKLLSDCLNKLFEVFPQADRGLVLLYAPDGALPSLLTAESDLGSTLAQRKTGTALSKLRAPNAAAQNELKLSRTVLNRVKTERAAVLMEKSGSMSLVDISSVVCAPMLVGSDDLGLIYLETRKVHQAFTKDDVSLLTAVAGQIAMVIRNSDLAKEAAEQAVHRENLSRFLSPNLVDQMLKGKLSVQLGGTEKVGTIFFSDLVGFTRMGGKMNAHDIVTLLNRYFTVMQNIIFRRGGSIDKCAGDEIMAHWGVVGELPDFTANGVAAAIEMQIALFAFNRDEAAKKEIVLPPTALGHGIGLNTGIVCAGNIGSDRKIEFTVIGDTVNKGSRIAHTPGRGQTFIGEMTFQELKDRTFCIRMPDCPAKNVEKPLEVYSVRGIVPPPPMDAANAQAKPEKKDLRIEDLLFSLPCYLQTADIKVEGMVTRIARSASGGYKLLLQIEKPIPNNTAVSLVWNVPEKPTMSKLEGEVDRCWQPTETLKIPSSSDAALTTTVPDALIGVPPKGGTAVLAVQLVPGTLIFSTKELPKDIADIKPGLLLQSDLKTYDDIVRA